MTTTADPTAVAQLVADLPPAPAIWCSGLRKRYGRQPAVDGVSFEVRRGEVVGLLGPNGAGKTTVIKTLLGLPRPDAGEAMLLGRSAAEPTARTAVGYLPELFRYQPWLSAAEVVTLHVRLSGIDVPKQRQRDSLPSWVWPNEPAIGWEASRRACSCARTCKSLRPGCGAEAHHRPLRGSRLPYRSRLRPLGQ